MDFSSGNSKFERSMEETLYGLSLEGKEALHLLELNEGSVLRYSVAALPLLRKKSVSNIQTKESNK